MKRFMYLSISKLCLSVAVLAALGGMLAGCASTPPAKFDFDPVIQVNGDFDTVWSAVVEYFAVGNLPIQTIEKDSGLIVTGWMNAGDRQNLKEDRTFCDCGNAGLLYTPQWTRGKFSVFVKKSAAGAVDLRVTCTFEQGRTITGSVSSIGCNSTGYLEHQIHAYVRAKVEGAAPPVVPTFKPGHDQ